MKGICGNGPDRLVVTVRLTRTEGRVFASVLKELVRSVRDTKMAEVKQSEC